MKLPILSAIILPLGLSLAPATAQTTLSDGGNLNEPAAWSNGVPTAGNDGTISVTTANNASTVFGFGVGSVTNLEAGTITANDGFNLTSGTWNISGGKIITRYFLSNGVDTIINLSGGEIELKSDSSNFISTGNGGTLNISGSAILNAASAVEQNISDPNGDINIALDWTGQWSVGSFVGDSWKVLFTTNPSMKLGGATIDETTFDANFRISDGGQTLSLGPPAPDTEFRGGDLLDVSNWENGFPLNPPEGTVAVDGVLSSDLVVADWKFEITAGTITAAQDWHFAGASEVELSGGILAVADDILAGDDTVMVFRGGSVTWGGTFEPSGTPGGTIEISAGSFTGTVDENTTLGNVAGGTVAVTGGTINASIVDFSEGENTALGGSAQLNANNAIFGVLNLMSTWTGQFTVTSFTGDDWETEFTSGRITMGGETVDATAFTQNFEVTDEGQTLSFRPITFFSGDDLLFGESWSNGVPRPGVEGVVAVDGFNSETVFGFNGTTIDHTDGTIASVDGFNFIRGDTWNMSGGRLSARYVLSNGQFGATVINISGGLVELTDVEGNQHMGAGNGGTFNVSGSAVLDGTQATLEVQTAGTVNIASDWTGEWIWGIYSGNEWRDLFLGGLITVDGEILTEEQFEANFVVSPDGTTLSRPSGPPIITGFTYNPDNTVTLTWESRPSAEAGYSLLFSSDLSLGVDNWPDENDSIRTGGDITTYTTQTTFPGPKTFFVIVANQ